MTSINYSEIELYYLARVLIEIGESLLDEEAARQYGSVSRVPVRSSGRAPWPDSHPWKRYAKSAADQKARGARRRPR